MSDTGKIKTLMPSKIQFLKCPNCGYEWRPRRSGSPQVCPKCKTRLRGAIPGMAELELAAELTKIRLEIERLISKLEEKKTVAIPSSTEAATQSPTLALPTSTGARAYILDYRFPFVFSESVTRFHDRRSDRFASFPAREVLDPRKDIDPFHCDPQRRFHRLWNSLCSFCERRMRLARSIPNMPEGTCSEVSMREFIV